MTAPTDEDSDIAPLGKDRHSTDDAMVEETSSFERCLPLLDARQVTELQGLLNHWSLTGLGRVLALNINPLERFLPPEDLREILMQLHAVRELDGGKLVSAYAKSCISYVQRGGPIRLDSRPAILGRAITRGRLLDHLCSTSLFSKNRDGANDFINRLLLGHPLSEAESRLPMSPWAAWVTWDMTGADDPFRFAAGLGKDYLQASLALDPRDRKEDLLLLVYRVSVDCPLLRPTIADAGTFPFFAPPPAGFRAHGLTKPWLPSMLKDGSPEPLPRPEAIHPSQPFSYLKMMARAT